MKGPKHFIFIRNLFDRIWVTRHLIHIIGDVGNEEPEFLEFRFDCSAFEGVATDLYIRGFTH